MAAYPPQVISPPVVGGAGPGFASGSAAGRGKPVAHTAQALPGGAQLQHPGVAGPAGLAGSAAATASRGAASSAVGPYGGAGLARAGPAAAVTGAVRPAMDPRQAASAPGRQVMASHQVQQQYHGTFSGEDGTAAAASRGAYTEAPPPRDSRGTYDSAGSLLRGVPAMEILVKYERSWSIQDALDQHSALAEQRDVLIEIGRNRLRVRQTQLSFAELEVQDALEAAKSMGPSDAGDPHRVLAFASRLRTAVRDLRLTVRLRQMEQATVEQRIALADAEIEKSRQEMSSMKEVIDDKSLVVALDDALPPPRAPAQRYSYCTNCKVGGHGQRFCEYFLERATWCVYPNQKWFEDERGNEYHCPLGKKIVDFADESHFSRIAMYLKGRAWLEEKTKVLELAPGLMPETFIIEKGVWKGHSPPPDHEVSNLPWFVKEADRNWGTSVHVCSKPSECMALAKPGSTYVVQQHIRDPLLTDDGRKCHIKFYVLLICLDDGVRWHLYTLKDGYLSISPNKWSPDDVSKETQVTIIRTERIGGWKAWDESYPKCKEAVGKVIQRAVTEGKLEGRLAKTQFEILSADFVVDQHGGVWLLEFNMSPVLKDEKDSPQVNDAAAIRGALHIVSPWEDGSPGLWDFVGEYQGHPPRPKEPPPQDAGRPLKSTAAQGPAEPAAPQGQAPEASGGGAEAQAPPS